MCVCKVTGGAQGLGFVAARALLDHGLSKLAIFDIDEPSGQRAVGHLLSLDESYATKVWFRKVDVAEEESVNGNVRAVAEWFGGIDILVCFAGITDSKLAVEYPIDSWKKIFDVNLHGSFLVARAVSRSNFPSLLLPRMYALLILQQRHHCSQRLGLDTFLRINVRLRRKHTSATFRLRGLQSRCPSSYALYGWRVGWP